MSSMTGLPTVLIFTYSEHGQANVNLATAYELALAGVNVHIASFPPLEPRVSRLQELILRHASRASSSKHIGSITFLECKGIASWREAMIKHGVKNADLSHPHGVSGALGSYPNAGAVLFPRAREEHLTAIERCKEIIATIKPNVVAVDYAFNIAQDACKLADQKFVIISPNSMKEIAAGTQPYLAVLWKYPALSSGFPFPLKWWQIPLNVYLAIRQIIEFTTSVEMRQVQALRRSLGFRSILGDQINQLYRGVTYICSALVETDFPFTVIPEEILLCGPIIMPFDPLEESDPALVKWLDNGPTVVVNLGTLVTSDSRATKEMASALRILLDFYERKGTSIQVLWKARTNEDIQPVIDDIIGKEVKEERVKVVPWLEVEPVSILQHSNVACTVHHGGANSFYEGIWSGIPHIVLPVWLDTYDYASRVEFLNIGIFGNKTCAPSVCAKELGEALVTVTGESEHAARLRRSAKDLREVCRAKGGGRKLASMTILKEAGIKE